MNVDQILDNLDTLSLAELRRVRACIHDLVEMIEGWQQPGAVNAIATPDGVLSARGCEVRERAL